MPTTTKDFEMKIMLIGISEYDGEMEVEGSDYNDCMKTIVHGKLWEEFGPEGFEIQVL